MNNNSNEMYSLDFTETVLILMNDYIISEPCAISEPTFHEDMIQSILEILLLSIDFKEEQIEDLEEQIEDISNIFYDTFIPKRSLFECPILSPPNISCLKNKITLLQELPELKQRTKEWYDYRANRITASNAYKAFESPAQQNQLIYEKCKPLLLIKEEEEEGGKKEIKTVQMIEYKNVNVDTTLHWGQKYEPMSLHFYETKFKTKVGEFGCLPHPIYSFLGASPDGINIDENSERYGRTVEIKNIINREITGIPKKEYWIQCQLQMEICDLDECDFLETRFSEYENESEWWQDSMELFPPNDDDIMKSSVFTSSEGDVKGFIFYFVMSDGTPFYKYIVETQENKFITMDALNTLQEKTIDFYQNAPYNYIWIKNLYWVLEEWSCVLIQRNRKWFQDNVGQLEQIWNIIEEERQTGFDHRKPKPRNLTTSNKQHLKDVCFLNFPLTLPFCKTDNMHEES